MYIIYKLIYRNLYQLFLCKVFLHPGARQLPCVDPCSVAAADAGRHATHRPQAAVRYGHGEREGCERLLQPNGESRQNCRQRYTA